MVNLSKLIKPNHPHLFWRSFRTDALRAFCILFSFILLSCNHKDKDDEDTKDAYIRSKTPVTITSPAKETISESITLNATSSFLKKNNIKSTTNGYIKTVDVVIGQELKTGQILFTLQTKEAAAYKNLDLKDTSLLYSGIITLKATTNGIVSSIAHFAGEYVQDGDQLLTISDRNSLVFLLSVPYELNKFIHVNSNCTINLPDSTEINARIDSRLSEMDASSQMESYMIKPLSYSTIPENLLATVSIIKSRKENATVLPKEAVLSNETQTSFWIMKLLNDTTAIKVPVTTGIHDKHKIEIISPDLTPSDKILLTGNYGLPDTAIVKIMK